MMEDDDARRRWAIEGKLLRANITRTDIEDYLRRHKRSWLTDADAARFAALQEENARLRARVKELEAERADLLTDEQAFWLYGMNPW